MPYDQSVCIWTRCVGSDKVGCHVPTVTNVIMREWLDKLGARRGSFEAKAVAPEATTDGEALEWIDAVCASLESTDGSEDDIPAVRALLIDKVSWLRNLYSRIGSDPEDEKRFVEFLLYVGACADTGRLRLARSTLRAFVDVSVQKCVMGVLVRRLAAQESPVGLSPAEIASMIVRHSPAFEAGHALLCDFLLEAGQTTRAEAAARDLLARNCFSVAAEHVLRRVAASREKGSSNGEASLRGRFCEMPFTSLYTSYKGGCFGCVPMWQPYAFGQLGGAGSPEEIWNSAAAQEIRRSILDGDFSYCSRDFCTQLRTDGLPVKSEIRDPRLRRYIDEHLTVLPDGPNVVSLSHDGACNLACPSCRSRAIGNDPAMAAELDGWKDTLILPLLRRTEGACVLSCNGDPLASRHYSGILSAFNPWEFPRLSVILITNGQLLVPEFWTTPVASMVFGVVVSVDAACAETYERVRPPAKWDCLMANLRCASEQRKRGRIRAFNLCFVVQRDNFRQMPDFVRLGIGLGVDTVMFQRYVSFGTDDPSEVKRQDVSSFDHPMHGEFLKILEDPVFENPVVRLLVRDGGVETQPPSIVQEWLRDVVRIERSTCAASTAGRGAAMP